MGDAVDVTVVIVSYNTREITRNCLASIYAKTTGVRFEVFVVDNGSRDGSPEMVHAEFPRARLIETGRNLGFGPANNLAYRQSRGRYVFFLNNDTLLVNNAILQFFEWMEKTNERVGVVGTMLEDEAGDVMGSYGLFPLYSGLLRQKAKALVTDPIRTLSFVLGNGKISFRRKRPVERRRLVDYIEGADLFVPRRVLDEVGAFDESYFLGVEDMDLQYRMRQTGYSRVIIPGPRIVHLQHKSSADPSGMKGVFSITHSFANWGLMYFLRRYKPSPLRQILKTLMLARYLNPVFLRLTVRNRCLSFLDERPRNGIR